MKIIGLLEKFYGVSAIPIGLFDHEKRIVMYPDSGLMPSFTIPEFLDFKKNNVFYKHLISNANLNYGFIYAKKEDMFILAGIVAENNMNSTAIRETIIEFNQVESDDISNLLNYFSKAPKMNAYDFEKYLSFLYYLINGEEPPHVDISIENSLQNHNIGSHKITTTESTHAMENELLSHVEYGRTKKLKKLVTFMDFKNIKPGINSSDTMRFLKNIFVGTATLAARSATSGGMDYHSALALSDYYLQKIEYLNTRNEFYNLWCEMLINFCSTVEKIKTLNASNHYSIAACNYALENTYSGLTVSSVAKELNVNRSYLSRIFKEDTGKNLSRFLNEIKVDEAKRLLKYSNMSLVNISFLLGFSTQNYFQKIFKDITKQTPLEYRKGVSQ